MTATSQSLLLHLGAHRTGSTSLQAVLDANAAPLSARGAAVLTPPRPGERDPDMQVRRALSGYLRHDGGGLARWRARRRAVRILAEATRDAAGPIILSDENLPGTAFAVGRPALYPDVARHMARLARLLPAPPARVLLCVRDYADLIPSYYAMMTLYANRRSPFDAVRPAFFPLARGWAQIAADIRTAFPETTITVAPLEQTDDATRLSALLGADLAATCDAPPRPRVNQRPTREAVAAALAGPKLSKAEADVLITRHAGGLPFDPLSLQEKADLTGRYGDDLDRLRGMDGVRLLARGA